MQQRCRTALIGIACLIVTSGYTGSVAGEDAPEGDPYAGIREQFLLTYTAVQAGIGAPASLDGEGLRAYPLYPYLQSARYTRALRNPDTDTDSAVREFITAHQDEPVGRTLHRTWLRSLAGRERWRDFVVNYRDDLADDELRCSYLRARVALDMTDGLSDDLIEQWRTPRQLPTACEPAFQWLRDRGLMTDELIEQRVRLLLESGQAAFARVIARRLPNDRAAPLLHWADLIEQPRQGIDAIIVTPDRPIESLALQDGWMRLARNSPQPAMERFPRLVAARGYDDTAASPYALRLALGLAWDRRPEALDYFARARDTDLDDYALEWQARAALWSGDWPRVERSIARMSDSSRNHARWRYWLARAAQAQGREREARERYEAIVPSDNFYAALAAAHLGREAVPHPDPVRVDTDTLRRVGATLPLVRARELLTIGLRSQAISEWYHGLARLNETQRQHAIAIAVEWGWYDVAVATATRESVFYDYLLLYPRPYPELVAAAAELGELAPQLLYGVVRQESLFRPDAVSTAGAVGLAQLLPETARRTANRWNMPEPGRADLFDPATNLRISAAHLRDLMSEFDNQTAVALAAYNAGPNAARRWLPDDALDMDIWIENIPFNETREYVQRVLWHSVVFGWLADGSAQDTSGWQGRIVNPRR